MVAGSRHPTVKSPHTSRARIGGARPVSGGAREAADRSCYMGDARSARPSSRMAVSRNVGTPRPQFMRFESVKGLPCCLVEDTPIVRRAYAGKATELRAARSFGSRRANYGASQPTDEKNNWNDAFLFELAVQSPAAHRDQENRPGSSRRK